MIVPVTLLSIAVEDGGLSRGPVPSANTAPTAGARARPGA
jgi:hypothetical protein